MASPSQPLFVAAGAEPYGGIYAANQAQRYVALMGSESFVSSVCSKDLFQLVIMRNVNRAR